MKKYNFVFKMSMLILVVIMTFSGCNGSSGGGEAEHNDVLQGLGVNTDVGTRTNPAGEPVKENYNPTNRPVVQLAKRSEIFTAGITGDVSTESWTPSNEYHVILDWEDGATNFTSYHVAGDSSWLRTPKALASGDVDGDGADEIIIAFRTTSTTPGSDYDLALKVVKLSEGEYIKIHEMTIASYAASAITEYPSAESWYMNFTVVCGDADGNGQSESLIAFNGSVFLIGDSDKDFGKLDSITYNKSGATAYKFLRLSAGDLDNNGTDEFVVVESSLQSNILYGNAMYHVYNGVTLDPLDLSDTTDAGKIIAATEGSTKTLHSASCAVGDINADGLNDILFVGEPENDGTYYIMILKTRWDDSLKKFIYGFINDYETVAVRNSGIVTPLCAVADFDGDGKKEFIVQRYIYENFSQAGNTFAKMSSVADAYSDVVIPWLFGSAWDCSLAVGDVDGDGKADVAFVSDGYQEMVCLGFNTTNQWVRKGPSNIVDNGDSFPGVVMGDFDGDSIAVEFIESEILFSNPHPIAVLAANPFWSGVDMGGETSFGTTTGSEVEQEKSIGFNVGFSVGYETEGPFDLWSASVKASFESSFDWTATSSVSIEESYTYSTESEDKVIFTAIPYDVYYYRVIKAPEEDMVGTVLTVNLPRKPVTLPVERNYYNSHNGGAMDIDSSLLSHSVGDPLSYPDSTEADSLIANGGGQGIKSTSMLTVGQSSGSTSIEMSVTNSNGSGFAFDFSVNIEAEYGAGGFTAGGNAGFHYGESYTVTTSDGMLYGGSVGNIPDEDFTLDRSFSWGLFSYKASLGNEQFVVVQYYTEKL